MAFVLRRSSALLSVQRLGLQAKVLRTLGARGFTGSTQFLRAATGPRFTEEQIQEISKYDAVLAQQIRTAKEHGLAMSWKDLDDIKVQPEAHYWPAEGGPPRPLSQPDPKKVESKKDVFAIPAGIDSKAQELWGSLKSKLSNLTGKKK
eukprot:TRINITY_DN7476_c0_g2_i1.p1 TRINITY_DN7476_c0_g2~~TRINITY_DN7476_c0_g2_i1.p1  ORF type:complete len:148 (-),score=32.44 TRINITY_DN7476_c0_g2_i1:45-488(-)